MRVTRSASTAGPSKRRADDAADVETTVANGASNTPKRARKVKAVPATPLPAPAIQSAAIVRTGNGEDTAPSAANVDDSEQIIVRPTLAFDLDAAKRHLVAADPRFASMFASLKCKPFEEDSDLNPFRALCSSILGQQISWLAARSITHKFIRLVAFPDLPEKPAPTGMTALFPTPAQVAACPVTTLRAAGLSQRKAEYVQDLATRFTDGRLSARALIDMSDEEVMKALIEVRGIGRWTVEMFMIFTLRRPDVLPCGDLGIQKGLVRWMTMVNPAIHARKLPETPGASTAEASATEIPARQSTPPAIASAETPATPMPVSTPGPPAPATPANDPNGMELPLMTPSTESQAQLPPFPDSKTLTRQSLKARLTKKIKGNIYLSPQEMEELTEAWKPYRSIGVWYLWSLADADTSFG